MYLLLLPVLFPGDGRGGSFFSFVGSSIVLYETSGGRLKNANLFVFAEKQNPAKLLANLLPAMRFGTGFDVNRVNDSSRTTDDISRVITNELLRFDECHVVPPMLNVVVYRTT